MHINNKEINTRKRKIIQHELLTPTYRQAKKEKQVISNKNLRNLKICIIFTKYIKPSLY